MKKITFYLLLFLSSLAVTGCRPVDYGAYPAGEALPPGAGYRITAHDTMEVLVYDNPDLTMQMQVSPSGMISFPMIGTVEVAGLTSPEAEILFQERLSEYIVNPRVNVTVPQIAERVVIYVSGQVRSPGAYRLTPGITAYQAITVAGGLTRVAAPNHVRVVRQGEKERKVISVRLGAMLKSGDMSGDIPLMPGDTIIVPESFF